MATQHLTPADRTARDAQVHHLAAAGHSNRAIGRELGIAHTTVATILRTTPAPARTAPEPAEHTAPAPAAPVEHTTPETSGNTPTPRLLHPLDPAFVQDLNCLMDPRTGALPDPIRRIIRAAADGRRSSMRTTAHHLATMERTTRKDAPMPTTHQCDEGCVCPEHGTPLIYSPATNDHACQDVECRYGHGMAATTGRAPARAQVAP